MKTEARVIQHQSRMAQFEQWLKGKRCPKCKKLRLIPKVPGNYRLVRCCGCGTSFMTKRKGD